jgi:glycosyltransferase involved in cell wall biosynthesis
VRGPAGELAIDLYSAADAVLFPSTWEGFGNPPVEAAIHRLPAAVGPYPVKTELLELGLRWYPTDDAAPLRAALANPDPDELERNRQVALRHLSLDAMSDSIRALLHDARWIP